jgi:hypothetical protein
MLISAPTVSIGTGVLRHKYRMDLDSLGVKRNLLRIIGDSLVIQAGARIGETAYVVGTDVGGRE